MRRDALVRVVVKFGGDDVEVRDVAVGDFIPDEVVDRLVSSATPVQSQLYLGNSDIKGVVGMSGIG